MANIAKELTYWDYGQPLYWDNLSTGTMYGALLFGYLSRSLELSQNNYFPPLMTMGLAHRDCNDII